MLKEHNPVPPGGIGAEAATGLCNPTLVELSALEPNPTTSITWSAVTAVEFPTDIKGMAIGAAMCTGIEKGPTDIPKLCSWDGS